MRSFSIKEFRPTILFLVKFVGIYVVGNFLYGLYITVHEPAPDPVTHWVTEQTAGVLTLFGWTVEAEDATDKPTTNLSYAGTKVLTVYEGCNGINTMIIFLAFLFSFGPINQALIWFIPMGLLVIHLMNLLRIMFLFWIVVYMRDYMYFMHKYFFTAILYVVIFLLWVWWVRKSSYNKAVTT